MVGDYLSFVMLPQVLRVLVRGQRGVVALLNLLAQRVQVHLVTFKPPEVTIYPCFGDPP